MLSASRCEASGQECPFHTTYFVRAAVQFVTKTGGVETQLRVQFDDLSWRVWVRFTAEG